MISISVVEDNSDFRKIITEFLKSSNQFIIKGIYADGESALKGLLADAPDIAIIDIKMPGISGIQLISKIKQSIPSTQFLICTVHHDNETVFKALEAGALGYILKEADGETIINAIIDLHNGGSPMSPYIARKIITQVQKVADPGDKYKLTHREHNVLELLARGLMYKEIADDMDISIFTVKNHLKNIYSKLQVQNKVEAVNKFKTF